MMLQWVDRVVEAADLRALGEVFDRELRRNVDAGSPVDQRTLADRLALEHQIRNFMARSNDRDFLFPHAFPEFSSRWVDFVDQNKAAELDLSRTPAASAYPTGLPIIASPALAVADTGLIRKIIQEELAAKGVPQFIAQETALSKNAAEPELPPPTCSPKRMSYLLAEFLQPPDPKRVRSFKGRTEAQAIIQFAIDFLNDPTMERVSRSEWDALDVAMTDIPHPKNMPGDHIKSLFARYRYAKDHGWTNLVRVTEKTLKSRYWFGLYKFIDWTITNKHYSGARPKFVCVDPKNLASLPRDAFEDSEILDILKLPLFTGCRNRTNVWKPGSYFVQSAIYWGFLICLFTGMRPGEVGQLECSQVRTDGLFFYFDLRPFNARAGRVPLEELRNLKTNAAGRVIPINPLLIELGLLDRVRELSELNEKRLFPEWEPYERSDGTFRWSQPLSKSWQYLKNRVLKDVRADVSLYSTRHFFADILDSNTIAQRTRDRLLGHVGDVRGRYGRNGVLDPAVAAQIEALEPSVMKSARDILLGAKQKADRGELTVLKTYR